MLYEQVSLAELVDRALLELRHPNEQGFRVVLSDNGVNDPSFTSFQLANPDRVNPTDVIQFGDELVLVTAKSSAVVPTFTCARGYYGTTPESHPSGVAGTVNPAYPRFRVADAVRRSFTRLEAFGVHPVVSATFSRPAGQGYVEMPAGCREVYDVWFLSEDGRLHDLDRWRFDHSLPTNKFGSGCAVRLPYYVSDHDDLEIRYRMPFRWSSHPAPPDADSTVDMPEGTQDLPSLYAAAWLVAAREISRMEIDRSEEWQRTELVMDRGSPGGLVRAQWQAFYRSLDEARRLMMVPARRQYFRMPKVRS